MDRCTITYNCAAPLCCAVKMAAMSTQRSGVRPSVRLCHLSTAAAACGGFAAGRSVGRRYRPIAGAGASSNGATARRSVAYASRVVLTAAVEG